MSLLIVRKQLKHGSLLHWGQPDEFYKGVELMAECGGVILGWARASCPTPPQVLRM